MTEKKLTKLIKELDGSEKNTRFDRLVTICIKVFGESTGGKGSHLKFKTPWKGDPRINLQRVKGGKAKAYQVEQVLEALKKVEESMK